MYQGGVETIRLNRKSDDDYRKIHLKQQKLHAAENEKILAQAELWVSS